MMFRDLITAVKRKYTLRSSEWMMQHFSSLFDQVADQYIVLFSEDIIYHQITIYSYYPPDKRPAIIGDYQLDHLSEDEEKVCIYVNHATQHLIIGYRGTDITNINDLMSDVELVLGVSGLDKRVEDSLRIYDLARKKYPEYTKGICGHSLGGTICYIVSKHRNPEHCTVFNPGSAPNTLFIQMLTDTVQKAPWTRYVYTYKILGDILSTFSFVGITKVFRISAVNPIILHGLENFAQPGVEYVSLIKSDKR